MARRRYTVEPAVYTPRRHFLGSSALYAVHGGKKGATQQLGRAITARRRINRQTGARLFPYINSATPNLSLAAVLNPRRKRR